MRAVRRTLGKFELCSWTTSRMPLEFCVGLLTFGFQFLASSARALLLLCGSIMAGIEQIFSVLSHVEVSTGSKSKPFTPAETKSSLCHHAFVGEIRCDLQSYGQSSSR